MTSAAYEAVFDVLYMLDHDSETEGDEDASYGWVLVDESLEEYSPAPDSPDPFNGLYNSLLSADPLGR